jgi:hypothetical protein
MSQLKADHQDGIDGSPAFAPVVAAAPVGVFLEVGVGDADMNSFTHRTLARLSQFAAVCLLLLIASPFTAPFATCELNDVVIDITLDDNGGSLAAKILIDSALPLFSAGLTPLTRSVAGFPLDSLLALAPLPQSSPLPLRL